MNVRVYIVRERLTGGRIVARIVPRRDGEAAPVGGQLAAVCENEAEYAAVAREVANQIPSEIPALNRPSLQSLAADHARLHWPKKKRNADLRRHGYDPDGNDGAEYRRFLHAAME